MKQLLILLFVLVSFQLHAQSQTGPNDAELPKRAALTFGFLQGGGSLAGADLEFMGSRNIGFQIGVGYIGFGAGLNYHFKPNIRSSFVSLMYWNQGIGDTFTQNVIGLNYVYRGKRWLTFQIGLGKPLSEGPALPYNFDQPNFMAMYAIGIYKPL